MRHPKTLRLLVLLSLLLLVLPARAQDLCLECHGDPEDEADRIADDPLGRAFSLEAFQAGVHGKLSCDTCHNESEEDGFEVVPHRMEPVAACLDCHDDDFEDVHSQFEASHHVVKLGDRFTCTTCHDPHALRKPESFTDRLERVRVANQACVDCHGNQAVYDAFAGEGVKPPNIDHAWLPSAEKHGTRMRCIVCHTPLNREGIHTILPRAMAQRDCAACHDENPVVGEKYLPPQEDRSRWITNPIIFEEAYMVGATKNKLVDGIIVGLLGLAVLGIVIHSLLRLLTGLGRTRGPVKVEKLYLYRAGTRFWHWSNAILFGILAVTGFRMHFGGKEEPVLSFETAWNVHNLAGALMLITMAGFLISNAVNGNARQYFQKIPDMVHALWRQARYYVWGIFRGEPHPTHATKERKFNPLQQVTYAVVLYGAMVVLAITGAMLLFKGIRPENLFGIPGAGAWAMLHYLVSAAATLFLLVHLYLITMGDRVSYGLRGMLSGWHRHDVPADEAHDEADAS